MSWPAPWGDDLFLTIQYSPPGRGMVEGEMWHQGDHSIFVQTQVPAMALTSEQFMELSTHVTHTAKDRPEIVDCDKLAVVALALRRLLLDFAVRQRAR